MDIIIRKMDANDSPQTKPFSRKSPVTSRLVLGIENEKLVYTIAAVEPPYEREVHAEDTDYGFSENGPTIFFAEVDGKLAGRIKVMEWWNRFGYVEDLVVKSDFRGMGIGRKLRICLKRLRPQRLQSHQPQHKRNCLILVFDILDMHRWFRYGGHRRLLNHRVEK